MIISNQPWSDYNITFFKPIIADMDVGYVPCPGCTMDIALVSVVEIVIARNKEKL